LLLIKLRPRNTVGRGQRRWKKMPSGNRVMKRCVHCGRENSDEATSCCECGTELIPAPLSAEPLRAWHKVAVLEHEVEADRLDVELDNRKIPHVMVNYRDSALDGLFQFSHGWGHIEAPLEHEALILSILRDLRESNSEPGQ
jgi:hypothetical protein